MAKCANCQEEAIYLIADPGVNELYYCAADLPQHMQARADAGHFTPSKSRIKRLNAVNESKAVEPDEGN